MEGYRCPWCGCEIIDDDYRECEPEEGYSVECPECGREFTVSYYFYPVFVVEVPDELEACSGCDLWDGTCDCCGLGSGKAERTADFRSFAGLPALAPMAGCPLGHGKEAANGQ